MCGVRGALTIGLSSQYGRITKNRSWLSATYGGVLNCPIQMSKWGIFQVPLGRGKGIHVGQHTFHFTSHLRSTQWVCSHKRLSYYIHLPSDVSVFWSTKKAKLMRKIGKSRWTATADRELTDSVSWESGASKVNYKVFRKKTTTSVPLSAVPSLDEALSGDKYSLGVTDSPAYDFVSSVLLLGLLTGPLTVLGHIFFALTYWCKAATDTEVMSLDL